MPTKNNSVCWQVWRRVASQVSLEHILLNRALSFLLSPICFRKSCYWKQGSVNLMHVYLFPSFLSQLGGNHCTPQSWYLQYVLFGALFPSCKCTFERFKSILFLIELIEHATSRWKLSEPPPTFLRGSNIWFNTEWMLPFRWILLSHARSSCLARLKISTLQDTLHRSW